MCSADAVPDAHDVSVAPADVPEDSVLRGRGDCAGSGRIACSEGAFGFGRRNAREGLSARHFDIGDFPELVSAMVQGDVQDGRSAAVWEADG